MQPRPVLLRRRVLVAGAITLLTGASAVTATATIRAESNSTNAAPPTPVLPAPPAVRSQTPSVSGDGRYLVYAGRPTRSKDPRHSTVFLEDRLTHKVDELTTIADGVPAGDSVLPVISRDGCTAVVVTQMAYDLFRDDDTGDRWDVYAVRLPQCGFGIRGDWQLVSATSGVGFNASARDDASPDDTPAISGDGTLVAYSHRFSAAAPDMTAISLVDLTVPVGQPGRDVPVAGEPADPPNTTFRYQGLREPSLSADGHVLAYTSDANSASALADWATGPQPGGYATSHVFVWDRTNLDRNTNVHDASLGASDDPGDAGTPAVSGDGTTVAFVSTATSLVAGAQLPACTPQCVPEVYLYHRTDGSVTLASRVGGDPTADPVGADEAATEPALDETGGQVVYVTRATNLFPTRNGVLGAPTDGDVVMAVPSAGIVRRVSVRADGVTPAPAVNSHPRLSSDGRVVAFDSMAPSAFAVKGSGRTVVALDERPAITLADLDLGTVAVGFPGPEWFLTVSNDGPGAFVPATVKVDNGDFLISGGSCVDQAHVPVPPGGACTINVMLSPSSASRRRGTLTVAEDGFDPLTVTSTLTGAGGDPALSGAPAGAEADTVLVGSKGKPTVFTIENIAFAPVTVGTVYLAGSDPQDYTLGNNTCTGHSLDAAATCTVEVIFAPTAGGRRTANLVAVTTGGAYTTMVVSGLAHYQPRIVTTNTTMLTPSRQEVVGAAFAPHTKVTISWADGHGRVVHGVTDAKGGLQLDLMVLANDRPGRRTLVAQTADGEVATTDVIVLGQDDGPQPGSAVWPAPAP